MSRKLSPRRALVATLALVGVTASLNRSKGDQDVAEWTPPIDDCRSIAGGCPDPTITVTVTG